MKKALVSSVMASAALISYDSQAVTLSDDFELIANIGAYSEYAMRGISYSQRNPVAQGYLTVAHKSGLYAGMWGSNVDIAGVDANYEADYYAGYIWQPTEDISLDVGYIKYTYPKTSAMNISETYAVLTAYGFKVGSYYSNDYLGDQTTTYNYVGYGFNLPLESKLDVRYGILDLKDPAFISSSGNTKDSYHEWEVKLSKTAFQVDWAVSYIDTNLSETECYSFMGDKESCSARVLLGVSKTF
ncbi:TorF family putative porin [Pseudomonas sp. BGr12]|uniref:TorF family putative porin n=1 Tax=Pseudomonas sp. BGr12 TaxID=2936269 RepID=UPI002559B82E|nr:TorF family putative porin [Pseudomonas sp. BJa5]MDL2428422.1 TorF family putative porin [Pseudomonas sp. BJa5]